VITIPRNLVRQVRAVFRRALGTSPRGPFPVVLFRATEHGLTIRSRSDMAAIEHTGSGKCAADEFVVRGELLVDCEGRSDDIVSIGRQDDGDLLASWRDKGVPVLMRYTPPNTAVLDEFPEPAEPMADNPGSLLPALRDASQIAEPASARYALDHIELCGDSGTIAATDGRQVLVQRGFSFPWQGKLLVPRSTVFGYKELRPPRVVTVCANDEWLSLRIGPWLYHLKRGEDLRFPTVSDHFRSADSAVARLQVSSEDAQSVCRSLSRLPGNDELYRPVTLDMNGQIVIRARGEEQPQPTELLLGESAYSAEPLRISTDRQYLARALQLGFREFFFYGANLPVQCGDDGREYVWAVLDPDSAIKPSSQALRVNVSDTDHSASDLPNKKRKKTRPMSEESTATKATPSKRPPRAKERAKPEAATNGDLTSLIDEARSALREADGKLRTLSTALKQHQKQVKLVRSTLSSLQQLQGIKAA